MEKSVVVKQEVSLEEVKSMTVLTKQALAMDAGLPWMCKEWTVEESLDSVYEVAARKNVSVLAYVQENPEQAIMVAEMSYAKWTNVMTQAALTGAVHTSEGAVPVSKNMIKALELRVKQAQHEVSLVTDYALSATFDNEKRRDHMIRTLYINAVMRKDTRALIYLIDRVDGRPGEARVAELDYDNAYNIYMIIHTLFDRQLNVLNSGNGTVLVCCSRRAGKCWAPDTLLRKHDGSVVRADEVKVGDVMMGSMGEPQTVLSLASGEDEMYRVCLNKPECGDGFVCNSVHVLTVKMTQSLDNVRSPYKHVYKQGQIYDIPLNEFMELPAYMQRCFSLFRVSVEYLAREHVIDPYILGLWLGDGDKYNFEIAVGVDEHEIMGEITSFTDRNGCEAHVRRYEREEGGRVNCVRMVSGGKGRSAPLVDELRRLDLVANKHIPQEYLVDSFDNRLELLAGLIDSNGHYIASRNQLEFDNIDKNLIDGVFELASSLGFKCTKNWREKKYWSCSLSGYKTVNVGMISVKGDIMLIPCRCPRKQPLENNKQDNIYQFYIEPVGVGSYNGFTLDGDGRLLLADYTVTHNTHLLVAASLIECLRVPNTTCIYIGETMELTEGLIDSACNEIVESCHLQDRRGRRFNWRKMDNGSQILVRGLSNTKDPDQIRGFKAKIIVIDEFYHLKSELLEYLQREVLQPMQIDYADGYKFICAGTPPQVKNTYGEYAWKNWDVPHFSWTWRENPHPVSLEDREAYVENMLNEKGLTWDTPFVRREYLGEWAYDDDLVLYPNAKGYDPYEALPSWPVSRVFFGIDYGVGDNDTVIGIAWSDEEAKGYEFFSVKFNRLDIKDRTMTQLEYLKQQVMKAWDTALAFFPTLNVKEANKRILWDADDNDQHLTEELSVHCVKEYDDEEGNVKKVGINIANAHKTDKKIMWDKIDELMRTGRLLLMKDGETMRECESTILLRGPNGEIYDEIDDKAYHPDLLPAMRYALWNVLGM